MAKQSRRERAKPLKDKPEQSKYASKGGKHAYSGSTLTPRQIRLEAERLAKWGY